MRYLFIFFILLGAQAREINPLEIEFFTVDELMPYSNMEAVPKVRVDSRKNRKQNFKPERFVAILKKGASVVDRKDGKYYLTQRPRYVIAEEEFLGAGRAFLWGKEGKTQLLTSVENLTSVQEDLEIMPTPQEYRVYPPRNRLLSSNKKFWTNNSIKYQQELISTGMMADILGVEPVIANGQRLVFSSFYKSRLPIQFGLNLNYQMGSWNSLSSWNALALGAQLRYRLYQKRRNALHLIIGYEQSLFYSLSAGTNSISLSGGSLLTEVSFSFPTQFGTFLLGLSMRFMSAQVLSEGYNNLSTDRKGINSYALTLGYNFDWGI